MAANLTIQDAAVRTGLSGPTLRYYEQVGLVGPIDRDPESGHRLYRDTDIETLGALACLRAIGMSIEEMRTYQANRLRGHELAAEQRDLLLKHAERIEAEIIAQHTRLAYLRDKAALWDARAVKDPAAEAQASARVTESLAMLAALR